MGTATLAKAAGKHRYKDAQEKIKTDLVAMAPYHPSQDISADPNANGAGITASTLNGEGFGENGLSGGEGNSDCPPGDPISEQVASTKFSATGNIKPYLTPVQNLIASQWQTGKRPVTIHPFLSGVVVAKRSDFALNYKIIELSFALF